MSTLNLFDKTARILALPIPRRKALTYLATAFSGAAVSFFWPTKLMAIGSDPFVSAFYCDCSTCYPRNDCWLKPLNAPCKTSSGQAGHCRGSKCEGKQIHFCCSCVPGPAPAQPAIADIPDVIISREASLKSGNCVEGTDFVLSWFPGRDSVLAREAATAAITHDKPILLRYIARTAHLVQRGAKM